MYKTVKQMALAHIAEYVAKMKEMGVYRKDDYVNEVEYRCIDVWNMHPYKMNNKKTRYLNKLLGLNKINK